MHQIFCLAHFVQELKPDNGFEILSLTALLLRKNQKQSSEKQV